MSIITANVTTGAANVYVSTGNTVVTYLNLCNYTASNVQANIWVVPNGASAGNLTAVVANIDIPAQDSYQFYVGNEKLILSDGDTIRVNASGNSSISVVTSYTSA